MTRRGIASLWAIVVLAVISLMTTAILGQMLATRRSLDAATHRIQAGHLVEAGERLARIKYKAHPAYSGETVVLLPNGNVVISVEPRGAGARRVTVVARFPTDRPRSVSITKTFDVGP